MPNINKPRLPAEWESQSGVMITWPHEHSDWSDLLSAIETTYLTLSKTITRFEKLLIIAYSEIHKNHIIKQLIQNQINLERIVFSIIKTNDTWTRDYGPICLDENNNHLLDFTFNGWGNKYDAGLDNTVTKQLAEKKILKAEKIDHLNFVLEGGSIDTDGKGTLLTTSACLLNKYRNPLLSKDNINHFIETTLGISKILWLDYGYLSGDDTDNHIDMLARFTNDETIVYVKCEDKTDEHFEALSKMEVQLKTFTNSENKPYTLKPLPFPAAIYDKPKDSKNSRRLPASYANFLVINNAVLVPVYNDENDPKAMAILKSCFPDREIIGIPFLTAIQQNGSLHCLTMQIPHGYL